MVVVVVVGVGVVRVVFATAPLVVAPPPILAAPRPRVSTHKQHMQNLTINEMNEGSVVKGADLGREARGRGGHGRDPRDGGLP